MVVCCRTDVRCCDLVGNLPRTGPFILSTRCGTEGQSRLRSFELSRAPQDLNGIPIHVLTGTYCGSHDHWLTDSMDVEQGPRFQTRCDRICESSLVGEI